MASAIRKSLSCLATSVVRANLKKTVIGQKLIAPSPARRGLSGFVGVAKNQKLSTFQLCQHSSAIQCRYSSTNSEVDKDFLEFLDKEISIETKESNALPKLNGWTIKTNKSEVEMKKSSGSEEICVKFNVNLSVDSADMYAEELNEESTPPKLVSRPDFKIELKKSGGKTVVFMCGFAEPMEKMEGAEEEQLDDLFSIQEVSIQEGEWSDEAYIMSCQSMDGNLYDHFMDMLDERGIGEDFMIQLQEFCTNYEHSLYLKFLEELKGIFKA